MVRAGREKLSGTVEVDEVFLGGVKPGNRGRGAAGKVLILVAVEDKGTAGFGRIRISVIPDATSVTRNFSHPSIPTLYAHQHTQGVIIDICQGSCPLQSSPHA